MGQSGRCVVGCALAWGLSTQALAGPQVLWVGEVAPTADQQARLEQQLGPHEVLDPVALMGAPAPEQSSVTVQVESALESARARWNDFDVELSIARDLAAVADGVDWLASEEEAAALRRLLMWQGAATVRAVAPGHLQDDKLQGLVRPLAGQLHATGFVDGAALFQERDVQAGDLPDGTAWHDWNTWGPVLAALPVAHVRLSGSFAEVRVDGRPHDPSVPLAPGVHRLHVQQGDEVVAFRRVELAPGQALDPWPAAHDAELARVAASGRHGRPVRLQGELGRAVERWSEASGDPVVLATGSATGVRIMPVQTGEGRRDGRARVPVSTWMSVGASSGITSSDLYVDAAPGRPKQALTTSVGLDVTVLVRRWAVAGGLEVPITPTEGIEVANADLTDNLRMQAYPRPWLGVGGRVFTSRAAQLDLLVEGAWHAPAWVGVGLRAHLGVRLSDRLGMRLFVTGAYSPASTWTIDPLLHPMVRVLGGVGLTWKL